jgi:hypothetical protein
MADPTFADFFDRSSGGDSAPKHPELQHVPPAEEPASPLRAQGPLKRLQGVPPDLTEPASALDKDHEAITYDNRSAYERDPVLPPTYFAERTSRLYEAALRGLSQAPAEMRVQLAALFEPETLFTLIVIVGLWAAAQLTPLGPFADVAILAYGGYGLVKDLIAAWDDFSAWYRLASEATTEEELDRAGAHFGQALGIVGTDLILVIVSSAGFRALRKKIAGDPKRFGRAPERPAEERPAERRPLAERITEQTPRRRPPSPLMGGLAAAGTIRNASDPDSNAKWWLIGGGVVVVLGLGAVLAGRKS